jgi:hypothetical protein
LATKFLARASSTGCETLAAKSSRSCLERAWQHLFSASLDSLEPFAKPPQPMERKQSTASSTPANQETTMNAMLDRTTRIVLVAVTLSCGVNAFAGLEMMDLDAPARAKLAKEKIRTSAQERQSQEEEAKSLDQSSCGSQSIGNIDTGGRAGAAPREEFVSAPNAINIVGRGGCR